MSVVDFYNSIREKFPGITATADQEHLGLWGDQDPASASLWFESLAAALNKEMASGVEAVQHAGLLRFIRAEYEAGEEAVRTCIDTAFVENLFWQVAAEKAGPYWQVVPDALKALYIAFHGRPPS